jgi:PhnB protein
MTKTPSIVPWLSVDNATQAVDFYQNAFGAKVLERLDDERGNIEVAKLSFGGAIAWVQQDTDSSPRTLGKAPVRMLLVVDDPRALFIQALAAGAKEIAAMHEEHEWLSGRVVDPLGHDWEFGKPMQADQL